MAKDVACAEERLINGRSRVDFALHYYRHLKKLRTHIESHPHDPVRLKDVAITVGISTSRLSHLFHEKTGVRFGDWICQKRIEKAKNMLVSDDASIADVAYSVGFRTTRSFERAFKRVNGKTASEYRRTFLTQIMSQA